MKIGALVRGAYDRVPVYYEVPVPGNAERSYFEMMETSDLGTAVDRNEEYYKILLSNGFVGWVHRGDVEEVR